MAHSKPRVLVTRASHQTSALIDRLRALGAEPVSVPALEIVDPISFDTLDTALAQLNTYQWLLFTSANAVEAFARRLEHRLHSVNLEAAALAMRAMREPGPDASEPQARNILPRLAAIGPATARSLVTHGLAPSPESVFMPPQAVAESFTAALLPFVHQPEGTPTRFLLVRAEDARELLPDTLRTAGAEVTVAPAYRTVIPESSVSALREMFAKPWHVPEAITFTSSSSARNLLALCEAAGVTLPPQAKRISIGPITTQTLVELGIPLHAESPQATVDSLAATVLDVLKN